MVMMIVMVILVYLAVVEVVVDASGLIILILRASIYSSQKIGAAVNTRHTHTHADAFMN